MKNKQLFIVMGVLLILAILVIKKPEPQNSIPYCYNYCNAAEYLAADYRAWCIGEGLTCTALAFESHPYCSGGTSGYAFECGQPEPYCDESDGGNNPYLSGDIESIEYTTVDSCAGSKLNEYYCDGTTGKYTVVTCENGCGGGKCFSSGCTNECSSGEKRCVDDYHYQNCVSQNSCYQWSGEYSCGSGKVCSNGNCVTSCTPSCVGKACNADDGCGGKCTAACTNCIPGTEICNGKDDDCDNQIDEGLNCQTEQCTTNADCSGGQTCTNSKCVTPQPPGPTPDSCSFDLKFITDLGIDCKYHLYVVIGGLFMIMMFMMMAMNRK